MKKQELIDAIRNTGAEVNSHATKESLQEIYDGLIVHGKPEPEPEPEEKPEPKPDEKPEPKPDEKPEPKPDEKAEPEVKEPAVNEFDQLLGKIKGAEAPEPKATKERPLITKETRKRKKGESSPDSFRVEGYVLLLVTDTVFPFLFAYLNNMLDKRIKITAFDLQLSQKDFDKLEPLADQAADYMAVQLNPIAGFFLVSTFFYSNNLITVRMAATPAKS